MDTAGFEEYPIIHKEKHYRLLAPHDLDMTFVEVRAMLDQLERQGAFMIAPEDDSDAGTLFTCELPGVTLEVDVRGIEVVIIKRTDD
jgi:hypothetical protein